MKLHVSRTYLKIDLDAVLFNLEEMHRHMKQDVKMIAIIKTDGYGHGAIAIARELETISYVWGYGVATVEEAALLRQAGIQKPVLILGYSFQEQYPYMIREHIRPAVFTYEMAKDFSDCAISLGMEAPVHIALDTGMSRIGYQTTETSLEEIKKIASLPNLQLEGIFTHFAKADEYDKTSANQQFEDYKNFTDRLEQEGIVIPYKHCSNSAGILELPHVHLDMVRAGIILYGMWPSEEVSKDIIPLKPAMEWKSKIVHIKDLEKGRTISYGGTYTMERDGRIATIPVGYGDGYPRSLSNKGYVLIHGKKAPICGRVCMDQFMVDVTDIEEVTLLDEVTLLGKDENLTITMEELGELSGRFNYEFACDISKRVPRLFYKNGQLIDEQILINE